MCRANEVQLGVLGQEERPRISSRRGRLLCLPDPDSDLYITTAINYIALTKPMQLVNCSHNNQCF